MKQKSIYQDIIAYHISGLNARNFTGSYVRPTQATIKSVGTLPLVVRKPQWVKFSDQYFHIQKEGLYRFWDWGKVKKTGPGALPKTIGKARQYAQVIFFRNDILRFLGSLAVIHLHGTHHQKLPHTKRLIEAKRGNLSLTCSYISDFCCELLKEFRWKTRRVAALRVKGEWNTFDNGHSLFEFYWPKLKKWILADVDMHSMFLKNGNYLSLGEVSQLIQQGKDFDLEPLTHPGFGGLDTSDGVLKNFSFSAMCEVMNYDPQIKKEWYRQTLEVPLIIDDQGAWFYCDNPKDRERTITNYSPWYKPMDKKDWFRKFYQ